MMNFLEKKIQNNKKVGTPTKKIKLNEDNQSISSDWEIPFGNLVFIKNISNAESSILPQKRNQQTFQISDFTIGQANHDISSFDKQNDPFEINKPNSMDVKQQSDFKLPKLNKRINSVQKCRIKEYDHLLTELSLTKHNSTFPIVDFSGIEDGQQFGQNIYLNQLLTLKAKISLTDANNQNRQILRNYKNQKFDEENRLEQNYQIKQTLGKYQPNKQGFICLNKLEKIFYYVKKIFLLKNNSQSLTPTQNDHYSLEKFLSNLSTSKRQIIPQSQTSLIRQQIKLYNKDSNSHLLRFYQQWIQNNSVFIIYELGSYSLADKILIGHKLPESEVWSIIYDSVECLKWIHECEKIHMNIKPGNIIKCRGKYKLTDPFVEKQFLEQQITNLDLDSQTFYLAPQIIQFQSYLEGIDFTRCQVFSLGMSILQNITSMPRSMKNGGFSEIKIYFKKQMPGYSSYLRRLLLRMISKNYNKRPTFEELLYSNIEQNQNEKMKIKNQIRFKRSNSI